MHKIFYNFFIAIAIVSLVEKVTFFANEPVFNLNPLFASHNKLLVFLLLPYSKSMM
jgi:hypothetical protein